MPTQGESVTTHPAPKVSYETIPLVRYTPQLGLVSNKQNTKTGDSNSFSAKVGLVQFPTETRNWHKNPKLKFGSWKIPVAIFPDKVRRSEKPLCQRNLTPKLISEIWHHILIPLLLVPNFFSSRNLLKIFTRSASLGKSMVLKSTSMRFFMLNELKISFVNWSASLGLQSKLLWTPVDSQWLK